jgi:hypothetical protein
MYDELHAMEVIVPDDQLSLAIGKNGQNVRLAARLTGWKIDVKSKSRMEKKEEPGAKDLMRLSGMEDKTADLLFREGSRRFPDRLADPEVLTTLSGISKERIQQWVSEAGKLIDEDTAAKEPAVRKTDLRGVSCMSKTRVYELAKEFNMENKELISRLEKLGIAVKSHSSTLEDYEGDRVREEFSLGKRSRVIEERVKSTVIRRRAIRPPEEPVPEGELAAEAAPEALAPEAAPAPAEAAVPPEPEKPAAVPDAPAPAAPPAPMAAAVPPPEAASPGKEGIPVEALPRRLKGGGSARARRDRRRWRRPRRNTRARRNRRWPRKRCPPGETAPGRHPPAAREEAKPAEAKKPAAEKEKPGKKKKTRGSRHGRRGHGQEETAPKVQKPDKMPLRVLVREEEEEAPERRTGKRESRRRPDEEDGNHDSQGAIKRRIKVDEAIRVGDLAGRWA